MRYCRAHPCTEEHALSLLPVILLAISLGLSVCITIAGRDRVKRALRESFAALHFTSPHGVVNGEAVQVVKVYKQGIGQAYDDVFSLGRRHAHDSFWYCVAPGPAYFLAIPLVEAGLGRVTVRWVVRLLTEGRMRAALQDDAEVLAKIFATKDSSAQ